MAATLRIPAPGTRYTATYSSQPQTTVVAPAGSRIGPILSAKPKPATRPVAPRPTDPPPPAPPSPGSGGGGGNTGTGPDRGGGGGGGGTTNTGSGLPPSPWGQQNPGQTLNGLDASGYMTSGQTGETPFWESPEIIAAQQGIDPEAIKNSPAVAAALQDFNLNVAPGIQNSMALSGLGRTTATANALARAQASMLQPLYSNAMNLENERLGRLSNATQYELGLRDTASAREAAALAQQAQLLLGYGQTQTERTNNAIQTALSAGATERQIRQQYGDAAYQDYLRRQGLAEEATYGPFGNMVGSTFGSIVRQSK